MNRHCWNPLFSTRTSARESRSGASVDSDEQGRELFHPSPYSESIDSRILYARHYRKSCSTSFRVLQLRRPFSGSESDFRRLAYTNHCTIGQTSNDSKIEVSYLQFVSVSLQIFRSEVRELLTGHVCRIYVFHINSLNFNLQPEFVLVRPKMVSSSWFSLTRSLACWLSVVDVVVERVPPSTLVYVDLYA